jgi:hypothetical protein
VTVDTIGQRVRPATSLLPSLERPGAVAAGRAVLLGTVAASLAVMAVATVSTVLDARPSVDPAPAPAPAVSAPAPAAARPAPPERPAPGEPAPAASAGSARIVDPQGNPVGRPLEAVLALLVATPASDRSLAELSGGEVAELLGSPQASSILQSGGGSVYVYGAVAAQRCSEYEPAKASWWALFCAAPDVGTLPRVEAQQVATWLAASASWERSAADLGARELAWILGKPQATFVLAAGSDGRPVRVGGSPTMCAEYVPADNGWWLVFCG